MIIIRLTYYCRLFIKAKIVFKFNNEIVVKKDIKKQAGGKNGKKAVT
jgi:hypothetical protein